MSDIVDLCAERDRRGGPDADFVHLDEHGRKLFVYVLDYEIDGSIFSIHMVARSMEDAERRVEAMKTSLVLKGQLYREIPF